MSKTFREFAADILHGVVNSIFSDAKDADVGFPRTKSEFLDFDLNLNYRER